MSGHTKERLRELQALPLERKVGFTAARITEWYSHYNGKVYVSFSGGKDSTVLLHVSRMLFPEIKAMFVNTGLEYPEIVQFVKTLENVDTVRPKITFKQVIEKYGYPVVSKEVSHYVQYGRKGGVYCLASLGICPLPNGEMRHRKYRRDNWAFLLNAPFKISDSCCSVMKKTPAKKYARETGLFPITAQMADESMLREKEWIKSGCNAFDKKAPISNPMSFWTEQDVLEYIAVKRIPIAPVYGEVLGFRGGALHYRVQAYRLCVLSLWDHAGRHAEPDSTPCKDPSGIVAVWHLQARVAGGDGVFRASV